MRESLTTIPKDGAISEGRVVVHNHVPPTRLGSRGFRAWLATPGEEPTGHLVRCDCPWAPEFPD